MTFGHIDLIFLDVDVMMPGLDGDAVLNIGDLSHEEKQQLELLL